MIVPKGNKLRAGVQTGEQAAEAFRRPDAPVRFHAEQQRQVEVRPVDARLVG
jgi:hypothetical protein